MSFTADIIQPLDYDFTGIPRNDGKGNMTQSGIVPEPTSQRLEAYTNSLQELFEIDKSTDEEEAKRKLEEKLNDDDAEAQLDQMLTLVANLCDNSPDLATLKQLPPRYQMAFIRWIQEELLNPEA